MLPNYTRTHRELHLLVSVARCCISACPQFINFTTYFLPWQRIQRLQNRWYYHRYYCCDSDSTLSYYL